MTWLDRLKRFPLGGRGKPHSTIWMNPTARTPPDRLELQDVPETWRCVSGPDFVGVGTPKAGTTWWYQLLLEHPSVVPNRVGQKELHYFCHVIANRHCQVDKEHYFNWFARPEGALCGEWSPGYFSFPLAINLLARTVPQAKVLVLLRDPIERAISHFAQINRVRTRFLVSDEERQYLFSTFSAFPEAVSGSSYAANAQRLLQFFPREQILILQYERCIVKAEEEIARTYRFLGVDDSFAPPSLRSQINASPQRPREHENTLNEFMSAYLINDVKMLVELFPEIDLDLWPSFQGVANRYEVAS